MVYRTRCLLLRRKKEEKKKTRIQKKKEKKRRFAGVFLVSSTTTVLGSLYVATYPKQPNILRLQHRPYVALFFSTGALSLSLSLSLTVSQPIWGRDTRLGEKVYPDRKRNSTPPEIGDPSIHRVTARFWPVRPIPSREDFSNLRELVDFYTSKPKPNGGNHFGVKET